MDKLKEIRYKLIELARSKRYKLTNYSELNENLGLNLNFSLERDQFKIGDWLSEITKYEFEKKRPVLSVIVYHANGSTHGEGFYKMCDEFFPKLSKKEIRDLEFENLLLTECREFWQNDFNYNKYKDDFLTTPTPNLGN